MAFWNRKDNEGTTRVTVDQSNATIGIRSVQNLNVNQIAGTINNGVKSTDKDQQPQPQPKPKTGGGQSIAIGFTGEDLEKFWGDD